MEFENLIEFEIHSISLFYNKQGWNPSYKLNYESISSSGFNSIIYGKHDIF
jgi:hypothetical protein